MTISSNAFQDVSNRAGIVWSRQRGDEAFTVNWTDLNNDGLLDLWVGGHGHNGSSAAFPEGKFPFRYINNGDGTFTLNNSDFRRGSGGDIHASTIIDFDNDGDPDIFSSAGGKLGRDSDGQPNLFFVNNAGNLQEQAAERGLTYSIGRGRSSLWFDANGDGLLDVLLLQATREDGRGATAFFQQGSDGTFFDASSEVGLNVNEPSRYAQLGDLSGDGRLDLLIQGTYNFPLKVYDFSSNGAWRDLTSDFSNLQAVLRDEPKDTSEDFFDTTAPRDSVIGDFNNDGFNDIFVVRSLTDIIEPSVFMGSSNMISADLFLRGEPELGFEFQTGGSIDIALDVRFVKTGATIDLSQIFIGAEGRNPTTAEIVAFMNTEGQFKETPNVMNPDLPKFVLSPEDITVAGIREDRSSQGLYVGFNPSRQTWEFQLASPNREDIQILVDSSQNIANLQPLGFTNPSDFSTINGVSDVLWVYNPSTGYYEDRSAAAGVDKNTLAQSVVAGDFDNDMDLDLYLANAYPSFNRPNTLYDNQGNGTFVEVPQAGGAAGSTIGPHRLDFEIGQRIAVADYDNNGFLDIFAGSTTALTSGGTTYFGTPSQLFRNQGNSNNWLIIDLEGVQSNRDGIGSRVWLTTPDGKTQLREQNSGIHHFAQNSQRLHFGLGDNTSITNLTIEWTSGIRQKFNNISNINRVVEIVEGGDIGEPGGIPPAAGDDSLVGTERGDILFGGDGNDTLIGLEGPDTLNGEDGNDSLEAGINNDSLNGGNDNDVLIAGEGRDTLVGESGNDRLRGEGGFDLLEGGVGNDTLNGGNGDDTIAGGRGTDVLTEFGNLDFTLTIDRLIGRGIDTFSEIEQVYLAGGGGSNLLNAINANLEVTLSGAGGADALMGGIRNDVLVGGSGADTIIGNNGNDLFVYKEISDRNDVLVDFLPSDDKLSFSAAGFGGGLTPETFLAAYRFNVGTSAIDDSDRFIYNSNDGSLFFDPDGTGSTEQILIAQLENTPQLSNNDISIVL